MAASLRRLSLGLLVLVFACACSSPSPTAPAAPAVDLSAPFSLNAGSVVGTGASAGTATISAKVQDGRGNPISGTVVSFSTNIGTITPASAATDKDGRATAALTNDDNAKVVIKVGALTYTLLVASEPHPPAPPVSTPPVLTPQPAPPAAPAPQPGYAVSIAASPSTTIAGGSPSTITAVAAPTNGATPASSYDWDCGNSTGAAASPSATMNCSYAAAGSFSVRVTAHGGGSAIGSASTTITVKPGLVATLACGPSAPTVVGKDTCTVSVSYGATPLPSSAVTNVSWDWGDGGVPIPATSATSTATHQYGATGVAVVVFATVTATTVDGPKTASVSTNYTSQ